MRDLLKKDTVLGTVLLLSASVSATEPPPARGGPGESISAGRVAALIAQLGSPQFDERQAATEALDALGLDALEPLRQARSSPDAEVRRRARQLVQQLERRLETARALEPTHLRLVYQDTPLTEAVADVARKTGLAIQFDGDPARLAERKVTLDTGDTTLWEALAEWCRTAGLVERDFRPGTTDPGYRYREDLRERRSISLGGLLGEITARQESQLILKAGSPQPRPTCQAGALRVRALPPDTLLPGHPRVDGETLLGLEVRLEPRLQLQSVLGLRIDRAVDDRDQALRQPSDAVAAPVGGAGTEVLIFWDGSSELPANLPSGAGQVPVRLRLSDRPSRHLKELHGTIALRVGTAPAPLVTVDRILKAGGQTVKGDEGSSLKVVEVRSEDDAQLTLQVEVTPPPRDLILDGMPARIVLADRGGWRGPWMPVPPAVAAEQLTLLDARGHTIPLADSKSPKVAGSGKAWELTLAYRPDPVQAEPARLIYAGRRSRALEVSFTLKDVPLP
jgi:hypothetical protein